MTFFERIKSFSKRRSESNPPVVAKIGKGSKAAYAAVADNRPFFADAWRAIVKWLLIFAGLALFLFLEWRLAKTIIELNYFILIVIAASIIYAMLFSRWPLAAYSAWLVLAPFVSIYGFSKPQSVLSLSFDRLALLLPILILTLRLMVDRRKVKMPTIPEWLLLAQAVFIRLPEWLAGGSGGILVAIGYLMAFVGGPICAYFVLKSCLKTRQHIVAFMLMLCGMGVLWAISGFYEHYTGYRWASLVVGEDISLGFQDIAKGRSTGPGQSYPIYGLVLNLTFVLAAHYFGFAKNKVFRFFSLLALPFVAVAMFFGYSKGAYITFGVFTLLMFILSGPKRAIYGGIVLGALVVVGLGYGWAMSDASFQTRMNFKNSLEGRTGMHITALRMFAANPIIGVGYGKFSDNADKYLIGSGHQRQFTRAGLIRSYSRPHSEYLAVLAEQGVVGFLLYFGAIFLILIRLFKLRSILADKDEFLRDLSSVFIGFIVCTLIINVNDEFYKYPYMYYIIYSVFAVAARIGELAAEEKPQLESAVVQDPHGEVLCR